MNRIEKLLAGDPNFVAVIYDSPKDPVNIDFEALFGDRAKTAKVYVENVFPYLNLPCVIDRFSSDELTEAKLQKIAYAKAHPEEYSFVSRNAFRTSGPMGCLSCLPQLSRLYQGPSLGRLLELSESIGKKLTEESIGAYKKLGTGEKWGYVQDLKDRVYTLLKFLEEQSQK